MRISFLVLFLLLAISWHTTDLFAGEVRAPGQVEWDKTVEAAKKEGKLVAGIPASAELRKSITESFKSRFPGIELELTTSRGPTNASKISAEHAAGVRYFDLLISGTSTPFNLLNAGILDPVEPLLILPEVKDPKRWFGGHIWLDNSKRFLYAFQAYQSQNFWYNSTLTKPEEIRSYDDLLNAKWKTKIGYLDPRSAGGGTATWAFFLKIKGEDFLNKLAAQDMLLSRDQRQLGDSLTKGKVALTIGLTYYSLAPFIKAEGQEIYGKAMGQATRRLDVETKWLTENGIRASKDFLTVEENNRLENYGEETVSNYWTKATKIAEEVLK